MKKVKARGVAAPPRSSIRAPEGYRPLLFPMRVLAVRQSDDGRMGEADLVVAAYNVPDTHVAVGLERRQVIDEGAFRVLTSDPGAHRPHGLDHFDAHVTGYSDSRKLVGYSDGWRDVDAEFDGVKMRGLGFTAHYNLRTQVGAEAFTNVEFMPEVIECSFRWPPDEVIEKGEDGFDHVREFSDILETTQTIFGAQSLTGPIPGSARQAEEETVTEPTIPTTETLATWIADPTFRGTIEGLLLRAHWTGDAVPPPYALLAEWLADDDFRAQARSMLEAGVMQGVAPAARSGDGMREMDLEALPRRVGDAWWSQYTEPAYQRGDEASWVVAIFADAADSREGHVIVRDGGGDLRRVAWTLDDKDEVGFNLDQSEEVEVQYVTTGRAAGTSARASDEADPMAVIYGHVMKRRQSAAAAARA